MSGVSKEKDPFIASLGKIYAGYTGGFAAFVVIIAIRHALISLRSWRSPRGVKAVRTAARPLPETRQHPACAKESRAHAES